MSESIEEAYQKAVEATFYGGLKAFVLSTGASLVGHRYWPLYRSMTLPGKVMLVAMATAGYAAFSGENSLYLSSRGVVQSIEKPHTEESFVERRRTEIVGGIVASALAASYWYFKNNSNRDVPQKIMSVRLFTQGVAIVSALSLIAISKFYEKKKDQDDK